jgi:hypothetical protein
LYASYLTVSGSGGTVDLMLKKVGLPEQMISRGQEGQTTPGLHDKRSVSVVIECGVISFGGVRLAPGNYNSSDNTIYGPY